MKAAIVVGPDRDLETAFLCPDTESHNLRMLRHSRAVVVAVVWWLCSPDLQQYFNSN